jgi:hypothetical protein
MAMEFPSLPFPSLRVAPSFVFVFVFVSFLPLHGSCPIRTQCHICRIWPGGMIWHSYVALRLVMFVQRANGDVPCGHLLPFCFVPLECSSSESPFSSNKSKPSLACIRIRKHKVASVRDADANAGKAATHHRASQALRHKVGFFYSR